MLKQHVQRAICSMGGPISSNLKGTKRKDMEEHKISNKAGRHQVA